MGRGSRQTTGKIKQGKFDKLAFKYDPEADCYTCPLGHSLIKRGGTRSGMSEGTRTYYRCGNCGECPVRAVCTTNRRGREVGRWWIDEVRVRHHERMKDPKHKADYKLRKQVVEPAIGIIKQVMGVRKFLLRELPFVEGEWDITCAAFNIKKIGKWAQRIGLQGLIAIANA